MTGIFITFIYIRVCGRHSSSSSACSIHLIRTLLTCWSPHRKLLVMTLVRRSGRCCPASTNVIPALANANKESSIQFGSCAIKIGKNAIHSNWSDWVDGGWGCGVTRRQCFRALWFNVLFIGFKSFRLDSNLEGYGNLFCLHCNCFVRTDTQEWGVGSLCWLAATD